MQAFVLKATSCNHLLKSQLEKQRQQLLMNEIEHKQNERLQKMDVKTDRISNPAPRFATQLFTTLPNPTRHKNPVCVFKTNEFPCF